MVSTLIVGIAGGILTFITHDQVDQADRWPSVLMIVLGFFGALFSVKHYELYRFHQTVAVSYLARVERDGGGPACTVFSEGRKKHLATKEWYGIMKYAHLYIFWTILNLGVSIAGIIVLSKT